MNDDKWLGVVVLCNLLLEGYKHALLCRATRDVSKLDGVDAVAHLVLAHKV